MDKSPAGLETEGAVRGLIRQARLIWRLLNDRRVPGWVKLVPVAGLVYLLSPVDLIPDLMLPGLGELDDVGVILLALKMFVQLAPARIVGEHADSLAGKKRPVSPASERTAGATIDVPYRVVRENRTESEPKAEV